MRPVNEAVAGVGALLDLAVVLALILALAVILASCEVFTNGIEWLGVRLGLAESATGSVLAAVGTAMPETVIPLIAIFLGSNHNGSKIGVGAILGAPFMLGTLAMFIGGITVYYRYRRGKGEAHLMVKQDHAERDMKHFMVMYIFALVAALLGIQTLFDPTLLHYLIAFALLVAYAVYLRHTLSDEREERENTCPALYMCRAFGVDASRGRTGFLLIILQIVAALLGMIIGARIFVSEIETAAIQLGVPALILAFLIAPIATELPEKFNSVIWYLRSKDTLGLGNITGAMVFQSSIPVSIGLVFTEWKIAPISLASIVIALAASAWMFYSIRHKGSLTYRVMLASGSLYVLYIVLLLVLGTG